MPNINRNNEIESLSQFQNALERVGRLRLKQGQKTNLSGTKKMQEVLKDIFKNKIKLIKKKECICTKKKEII